MVEDDFQCGLCFLGFGAVFPQFGDDENRTLKEEAAGTRD
jgi:hypothetical protein